MHYTIEGTVTNAAGQPLPEVSITVAQAPGSVRDIAAITDDRGRFSLHDLPAAGTYHILLTGPAGQQLRHGVRVRDSVTNVRVQLPE